MVTVALVVELTSVIVNVAVEGTAMSFAKTSNDVLLVSSATSNVSSDSKRHVDDSQDCGSEDNLIFSQGGGFTVEQRSQLRKFVCPIAGEFGDARGEADHRDTHQQELAQAQRLGARRGTGVVNQARRGRVAELAIVVFRTVDDVTRDFRQSAGIIDVDVGGEYATETV